MFRSDACSSLPPSLNPELPGATILRMSAAHVVGIAILALTSLLRAQSPPATTELTIKVIDMPEREASRDWLTYSLRTPAQQSTVASAHGEAIAKVTPGTYAVSVTSPGFKHLIQEIEVESSFKASAHRQTRLIATPL